MGLAPWLPFAGARGAKARRKPDRGGESHQHASSDTGGGLLVNPRCRRRAWRHANADCASGEGALGDGRRPGPANAAVFDETAAEAGPATRSDGDAVSRPHLPRVVTEDVRGYVASPARGRKHRGREVQRGGAVDQGSARTALRHARERSSLRVRTSLRATLRGSRVGCGGAEAGGSPSSEAPLGRLIWQADRQAPRPRRRLAPAQGESVLRSAIPAARQGARRGVRPGIGPSVGCS